MAKLKLHEKTTDRFCPGKWFRTVEYDGKTYRVGVYPTKRVRLAYSSKYGFQWHGDVYHEGRILWTGQVTKTTGARGLLKKAGVIAPPTTEA